MPDSDPTTVFVEEMGDLFDQMGSSRIAGRIVGRLLVCDPPHQSAAEIGESVQASKASVSTVVRQLQEGGLIERLGLPGSRLTYYRIKDDAWTRVYLSKMRFTQEFRRVAERGLAALGDDPDKHRRLRDMSDFYGFFADEMQDSLERWQRQARKAD